MQDGGPFEITLGNPEVTSLLSSGRDRVDVRVDFDQQLLPPGSGGLLPALALWQRLLRLGPQKFGEVYYLGTAPLIDQAGLFDILVGTHNVAECRFAFDPDTGHLVGVEMFPESQVDPCELYLSDYRDVDGRLLPHRILVRYGDTIYADMQVDQYEMNTADNSS
jgi:hypothetical protein